MSRDGWLPPEVSHEDVESAAGWRPSRKKSPEVKQNLRGHCVACGHKLDDYEAVDAICLFCQEEAR